MIKPTHKAIKDYYRQREALARQHVLHEMGVRSAFQMLLQQTAPQAGWTLVTEETLPKSRLRPDGTLKDDYQFRRGYWESKDEHDDLHKEIEAKIRLGYPTNNTIFEDSRLAVLFQNRREAMRAPLDNARALADLLNTFYSYREPHIEDFEKAVDEFRERVPELAAGLLEKIEASYKRNAAFKQAFDGFFELCKTSLNPNIRAEAVREMLVQHLLTERLIRNIFDNPEFRRRNVIAAEVENVIDALTGEYFNRQQFLDSLNRFYTAIERAAQEQSEFSEKQKFLNAIYERFFQGFSVKVADTHGIVYTPQPIVDFMCASVAEALKTEFGKELGDREVFIIDPCTGTGNFVVNLMRRMPQRDLPRVFREQLFANEVMLMPYYIAALNIEHAYYEITEKYESFEGLCFVDTLDLVYEQERKKGKDKGQVKLPLSEKNLERVERQRRSPITVVIGNPPYNANQLNENDNNKNRAYPILDRHLTQTYAADSEATNRNKLRDPYVRFIRWATDRLEDRDGIVCFVTNNSFVEQIAFDGMRKHLEEDFSTIYHCDLHGNVYKNPKLSGTTHNVFGIKVGVGITIGIKKSKKKPAIYYHRVPEFLRKEEKLEFLSNAGSVAGIKWQRLKPDAKHNWFPPEHADEFDGFIPLGTKEAKAGNDDQTVFGLFSNGVKTNRDMVVYDYNKQSLSSRIKLTIESYNNEVLRYQQEGRPKNIDEFVRYVSVDWSEGLKDRLQRERYLKFGGEAIRYAMYRPFDKRLLYFDSDLIERTYRQSNIFPTGEASNHVICVSAIAGEKPFLSFIVGIVPNLSFTGFGSPIQCFPFYVYDADGSNRRENITDWALEEFRRKYAPPIPPASGGGSEITKWDIFYYAYGLLHHPGYRERFADNLRKDLPRLPFAPDFWAFSDAGRQLAELHLKYEELPPVWEAAASESPHVYGGTEGGHAPDAHTALPASESPHVYGGTEGGQAPDAHTALPASESPHVYGGTEGGQAPDEHTAPPIPPASGGGSESPLSWDTITPETWDRAQELRRAMTPAEKKLWKALRAKQLGLNFRRQHPLGPFIADFYAPEARLVVEVDGDSHTDPDQVRHDAERTRFLEAHGLLVIRYSNRQINESLDAVVQEIRDIVESRTKAAPPAPESPHVHGGTEGGQKTAPPNPPAGGGGSEATHCQVVFDESKRLSYRVEKMRLSKDKTELKINDSISVLNIPRDTFEYRLGNRSALEWVADQYQIKTDKRSGITHDPNRDDDPEYIVRLVGQVIRVSLETVRIVRALPTEFN